MAGLVNNLTARVEKLQGTAARLIMKLPPFSQRAIAKALGFNEEFSNLDPHLQIVVSARAFMDEGGLIGSNPEKSRRRFRKEMRSLIDKPTPVESVKDFEIPVNSTQIGVRHYTPKLTGRAITNDGKLPLLVFFHGGGFVVGDLDTHDEPCRLFCQQAQVHVLSINYRLAPEHPAPAAAEDCLEALKWAYEHAADLDIDPTKIAVGGDSAGGNLSAVVSQLAVGKPYAPAAQLLIYPCVDLKNQFPSHLAYGKGLFLNQSDMDNAKSSYVTSGKLTLSDPLVSPLFGNLTGLPPALLITAELDALRDEGEMYAVKMREAGSHCIAHRIEHQGHGFINITSINRQALAATQQIAHDFRALLDGRLDR